MKTFKEFIKEDLGAPETFYIEKGLTSEEVIKKAPKPKGDWRARSYNPKTGRFTYH